MLESIKRMNVCEKRYLDEHILDRFNTLIKLRKNKACITLKLVSHLLYGCLLIVKGKRVFNFISKK